MLPAVPMSISPSNPFNSAGMNFNRVERNSRPSVSPPDNRSTAFTAFKCCAESPGFGLFALIFIISTPSPVTAASATAVLIICPPPSPNEPSISIIAFQYAAYFRSIHGNSPFPVLRFFSLFYSGLTTYCT